MRRLIFITAALADLTTAAFGGQASCWPERPYYFDAPPEQRTGAVLASLGFLPFTLAIGIAASETGRGALCMPLLQATHLFLVSTKRGDGY